MFRHLINLSITMIIILDSKKFLPNFYSSLIFSIKNNVIPQLNEKKHNPTLKTSGHIILSVTSLRYGIIKGLAAEANSGRVIINPTAVHNSFP